MFTRMQAVGLLSAAILGAAIVGFFFSWVLDWNYWKNITALELWVTLVTVVLVWAALFLPGILDERRREKDRLAEERKIMESAADKVATHNKYLKMGNYE